MYVLAAAIGFGSALLLIGLGEIITRREARRH
jgi:hypothetical protein